MEIDANVKSIEKLRDFFFVVPDYQREYVWKADDQVEQFLYDIDSEYDRSDTDPPLYRKDARMLAVGSDSCRGASSLRLYRELGVPDMTVK